MAHTPLLSMFERAARELRASDGGRSGPAPGPSRRGFLAGAAAVGAAAATWRLGQSAPAAAAASERIIIVGAGLAGLTCAYDLRMAGYVAEVHDAHPDRLGGRAWSDRQTFSAGQITEHGGELIDQGHTQVRQLCRSLGLVLDNLLAAEQSGTEPKFWFDNSSYTYAAATTDIKSIWQKIKSDVQAASYPTLYNLSTARGRQLDSMSIIDWIEESVPGGMSSRLGQLLDVAYNIEYGAECSDQSSLNLLYLLGYSGQGQLRLFGPSNEKYHVRGGNDLIVSGLAAQLDGQIVSGSALTKIVQRADGGYDLTFRRAGKSVIHTADRVVLALPFAVLRTLDFSRAGFGERKIRAIREQGMGTNSKLNVQFVDRHWRTLGGNGDSYADTGYQATWEVTRAQPGTPGILVDYTGGLIGASFGTGTPQTRAATFASQLEPVFPGIGSKLNGRATIDYWPGSAYQRGSYSYWKVGQYQAFAGVERERSGRCHFAGEHTSVDFQGYLNGAVETGQRAAAEILGDYK
jgi:monoamine oxidase